ncbi:MAG TPA: DUF4129 domain-containing protein [Silvibacterium sp.]|nr:DUF4129 domain-containing protein [Silvibacterium sp.]
MRRRLLVPALVSVLMVAAPLEASALGQSSLKDYRVHLDKLHALVESCEANASACDASAVGPDESVEIRGLGAGANANSFEAHYDWLRDVLKSARDAGNSKRGDELHGAEARLAEMAREASGVRGSAPDIAMARKHADAILEHAEFATVRDDSLWERIAALIGLWLDKLFNNVAKFGKRSPWIGPLMEWGLIGVVLLGLALWAMRALRRQRLAVRVEAAKQMEPWEEAARNWRGLAEEQAARGEWREAVHCLYWASIAVLEGRRMWTPNRSRTPREYVRLMEAGSARRGLLRQQTQGFERVWYGLRDAGRQEYERALKLHEELRVA